jgi:hypothetical protein
MSSIQGVRGGKNEIMNFVGATFKSPVFVLPPPSGPPSKGRQKCINLNCPPLEEVAP